MYKPLSVLAVLLLMALSASAQDSARHIGYSIKLNVSGRYLTGQFDQFVLSTRLDAQVESKKMLLHNSSSYRFNRTSALVIEDNWYQLISLIYAHHRRFSPVGFYHFDNNLMFRVKRRHLYGLGAGTGKEWVSHSFRLDVGLGYDHTTYAGQTFENSDKTGSTRSRSLAIARLLHHHRLFKEKIILNNDVFYRHSLEEASDFMMIVNAGLSVAILKNLLMTGNFEYRFENVHLSALPALNTTLLFGLTYSIDRN